MRKRLTNKTMAKAKRTKKSSKESPMMMTGMKECMAHLMNKRGYPAEQAKQMCEAEMAK